MEDDKDHGAELAAVQPIQDVAERLPASGWRSFLSFVFTDNGAAVQQLSDAEFQERLCAAWDAMEKERDGYKALAHGHGEDAHRLAVELTDLERLAARVVTLWAGECQHGFGLDAFDAAIADLSKKANEGPDKFQRPPGPREQVSAGQENTTVGSASVVAGEASASPHRSESAEGTSSNAQPRKGKT